MREPSELADALARIASAKENYVLFVQEIERFLYEHVKGMVKGLDLETNTFVLQFRSPEESYITGTPKVLVTQIVENLRSALDYMVFELSRLNVTNLDERRPQFVIVGSGTEFRRQAKSRLRYLTEEQKSFVEQIQPYHGNSMLGLLGDIAGLGKHRSLLSIRNQTRFHVCFGEISKKGRFKDYFVYPVEEEHAIFAKPNDKRIVLLMEKFNAMSILRAMIEHTADILRVSYCFFEGRPFKLSIVRG